MAPADTHCEFTPYDCIPGDGWDAFDQALLIHCTGEVDDRGWSLADHLLGQDEGSAGGPALPAGYSDCDGAELVHGAWRTIHDDQHASSKQVSVMLC